MTTATPAARPKFGQVYHCAICGAEATVIRAAGGQLAPRCCNCYMTLKDDLAAGFFCPICGSQAVVIRQTDGDLAPRCCNRPMIRR